MWDDIALVLSSLGVGSLLGIFAKSILDKRQLMFTKGFEFKEVRYKAITILMLAAVNPTKYDQLQLRMRRPEIADLDDLDRELELEYYNAMLFASDDVLRSFEIFLKEKSKANYEAVARAMRRDLYH
jgi:hypothetical protein